MIGLGSDKNQMNKHFGQEQVVHTIVPLAMLAFNHLLRNMSRASASEVAWTCAGGPTHSYGVLSTCVRGAQGEGMDITYQCHCRVNLQCVLIIPLKGQELLEKAGKTTMALKPPLSLTEGWSPT